MLKKKLRNNPKISLMLILILFTVFLPAFVCFSSSSPISVSIDPSEVSVGEIFEVVVIISGSNIEEPEFIHIDGVSIDNNPTYSGMSTQVQFAFGKTSVITTKERRYKGLAEKEGEWTIQVKAKIDGKEYISAPVVLKVTKNVSSKKQPIPSAPSPQRRQSQRRFSTPKYPSQPRSLAPTLDNSLIVESEVTKKLIYQGEIVHLILRAKIIDAPDISIRTPTGNIPDPPELDNFFVGKAEQSSKTEIIENHSYKVMELKVPICPKGVGTFRIPPWTWNASIIYYGNWGWPDTYTLQKETEPISIEVRPLPSSPPAFYGAVGKFNITTNVSNTEVELGTPMYLTLTITGEGYPEFVKPPQIGSLDWAYVSGPEVISTRLDSWNNVEKSFKYTISPMKSGEFKINPIDYTYFNPQLGQYATLKTQTFNIKVRQTSDNSIVTAGGAPRLETLSLDVSKSELLPLITEGAQLKPIRNAGKVGKAALIIVPPIVSSILYIGGRRRQALLSNPVLLRKKNAYKNAIKKYEEFRRNMPTTLVVENVLKQYIGDLIGLENPLGMTSDEISDVLSNHVLNPEGVEKVRKLLKTCERLRYARTKETSTSEEIGLESAFIEVVKTLRGLVK